MAAEQASENQRPAVKLNIVLKCSPWSHFCAGADLRHPCRFQGLHLLAHSAAMWLRFCRFRSKQVPYALFSLLSSSALRSSKPGLPSRANMFFL